MHHRNKLTNANFLPKKKKHLPDASRQTPEKRYNYSPILFFIKKNTVNLTYRPVTTNIEFRRSYDVKGDPA